MAKRIEDLKIVDNKHLTDDFCVLELESQTKIPEFKPGQFVQVKVEDSPSTFLRRPISVHDVDFTGNRYKLLIQVLGKGTEMLYNLKNGADLNVIHPLGNSFSVPESGQKILLAGGGTGIAPLLFLGKYLKNKGFEIEYLLGFRNRLRVILLDEFSSVGKVHISTEDGSFGEKGLLTSHSVLKSEKIDMIYCCGPDPMMHSVADYCRKHNIRCEVSLENLMACGFGICLCCIVGTTRGNICTCTEGPVFNIRELKW